MTSYKPKVRKCFRLSLEANRMLKFLSERRGVSQNDIIQMAIMQGYEREKRRKILK